MKAYRSGAAESVTYAIVRALVGTGFTAPLAWATPPRDGAGAAAKDQMSMRRIHVRPVR